MTVGVDGGERRERNTGEAEGARGTEEHRRRKREREGQERVSGAAMAWEGYLIVHHEGDVRELTMVDQRA